MVWRKVQVARPSDSTSGGQCAAATAAARRPASSSSRAAVIVDDASATAVVEAMARAAESLLPLLSRFVEAVLLVVAGGLQFRKEVQILQGLPSGPRTMPGGSGRGIEDEGWVVDVSDLVLVLIVAPQPLQTGGERLNRAVRLVALRHRAGSPAAVHLFLARPANPNAPYSSPLA